MSEKKALLEEVLKKQEEEREKEEREYRALLCNAARGQRVIRCRECRHKGNPWNCVLDRDLEEHGSHRTDEWDDWFCGDAEAKDGEQE